jgi:hypothetical protein
MAGQEIIVSFARLAAFDGTRSAPKEIGDMGHPLICYRDKV